MPNGNNEKAIEVVQEELEFRRTKLWDIFSWCSTVLIAITGGILALETAAPRRQVFKWWECLAITIAVGAITLFAEMWLSYNLYREGEIVEKLNDKLNIKRLGITRYTQPHVSIWGRMQQKVSCNG